MIASIIILLRYEKIKEIGMYFFIIGSVTSFLDLLTQPIVTLGIPALIYFLLKRKENKLDVKAIGEYIKIGILWGIGYGTTWISKWVITDLVLGRNTLQLALQQVVFRIGSKGDFVGTHYTFWDTIKTNMSYYGNRIIQFVLIESFIAIGLGMLSTKQKNLKFKELIFDLAPDLITFLLPFVWYGVLKNHSLHHPFFTNRILILSILSIQVISCKIGGWYEERKELEKEEER